MNVQLLRHIMEKNMLNYFGSSPSRSMQIDFVQLFESILNQNENQSTTAAKPNAKSHAGAMACAFR
jgi:hypothetical protein